MRTARRIMGVAATIAVAGGLTLIAPATAQAGTVTVTWGCGSPLGPGGQKGLRITVTAPAAATAGETVTIQANTVETTNHPWAEPAGRYTARLAIAVGGPAAETIHAEGLSNPATAEGTPLRLDGGTARVTLPTAGDVTFEPTGLLVSIDGIFRFVCGGTAPIAATTRVS
ncbi:hypothetical protein [Amycolatopsis sp. NPDC057786]|uniref:hypothetical protein n=1 Tax=Amycolatopsis sp. NPDC057786 TaxID=3346250 RepID=UPI00366E2922